MIDNHQHQRHRFDDIRLSWRPGQQPQQPAIDGIEARMLSSSFPLSAPRQGARF
jgi:hypothetical protein